MDLKGKIINFLGDSITEGNSVVDLNNRYDNVIKKEYGLKESYNYGIGGTRLAHQTIPSVKPRHDLCFCGRAYDLNPDADVIVVYGGVNDYISGDAPIGNWGDKTPATFYGAVWFLMDFLKSNYKSKIVFISPAHVCYNGVVDYKPSNYPTKRDDALPLVEYVKIIEKTAKEFNIPMLNLYETLKINPNDNKDYEKFTADGLHFNDEGHKILARCVGEFLKSL